MTKTDDGQSCLLYEASAAAYCNQFLSGQLPDGGYTSAGGLADGGSAEYCCAVAPGGATPTDHMCLLIQTGATIPSDAQCYCSTNVSLIYGVTCH